MPPPVQDPKMDRLSEFYDGKSILMTGAAGYLGTVLLEVLLRCFPGIVRVYIMLRPKNGIEPQERKNIIFKKEIFYKVLENYPHIADKVEVVSGDLTSPNFGMSEEAVLRMSQEVSIVFHCAALISFKKPVRVTAMSNSKGTHMMIEFCRKLKKLDVLVYTSTAYSNSHKYPNAIEEKVCKLAYTAQRFLEELETGDTESFAKLVADCNGKWPNPYAFSKCLAEVILQEEAADLPIAILRPSIIFATMKGPDPGYLEAGTGIVNLCSGVGRGFIKVIQGDPDSIFDVIPSDIVANAHVAAAWCVGTNRCASPFIVNCTSGDVLKLNFGHYKDTMYDLSVKYPLTKALQLPECRIINNRFLYVSQTLYEHYIPAYILDVLLRFQGNKLRLVKLYRFFDLMMETLYYFTSTTFDFKTDNFKSLSKLLPEEDREIIYTDFYGESFYEMVKNLPFGSNVFHLEMSEETRCTHERTVYIRSLVISFIKRFTLFALIYLVYYIVNKIFFQP